MTTAVKYPLLIIRSLTSTGLSGRFLMTDVRRGKAHPAQTPLRLPEKGPSRKSKDLLLLPNTPFTNESRLCPCYNADPHFSSSRAMGAVRCCCRLLLFRSVLTFQVASVISCCHIIFMLRPQIGMPQRAQRAFVVRL